MSAETKEFNLNEMIKTLTEENAELRATQDQAQQKLKDLTRFYESELHSVNARYDVLFQKHLKESKRLQELMIEMEDNKHVKKARHELTTERSTLKDLARQMVGEVQYLKKIFPLRSLLAAKEIEIKRMKASLLRLPEGHAERRNIEGFVKDHINERDQYFKMISLAEKKFDQQMAELEAVANELELRGEAGMPRKQRAAEPAAPANELSELDIALGELDV